MIFILPIRVEGRTSDSESTPPRRPTPVVLITATMLVALFLLEQLATMRLERGWSTMPESVARAVTLVMSDWKLYGNRGLFHPWQLWTYSLLHDGWWHLIGNLIFFVVFGKAVERWIGSWSFALSLLVLAPMAGSLFLRPLLAGVDVPDQQPVAALIGASGAITGVMGLGWALFPRHEVRCAIGYWIVLIVGFIPFRLAVRWLVIVYVIQDVLRLYLGHQGVAYEVHLGGVIAGFGLGTAVKILHKRGFVALGHEAR